MQFPVRQEGEISNEVPWVTAQPKTIPEEMTPTISVVERLIPDSVSAPAYLRKDWALSRSAEAVELILQASFVIIYCTVGSIPTAKTVSVAPRQATKLLQIR